MRYIYIVEIENTEMGVNFRLLNDTFWLLNDTLVSRDTFYQDWLN